MKEFNISPAPHIHNGVNTQKIMFSVIIALLPTFIMAIVIFGLSVISVTAVSVLSCAIFQFVMSAVFKRKNAFTDMSFAVTGLLIAFSLPVNVPLYVPIAGSFFAIVIIKEFCGGIGKNILNPALAARVFLGIMFKEDVSNLSRPFGYWNDAASSATPLSYMNGAGGELSLDALFIGTYSGCIGETCAVALLFGGIYLIIRKVITPTIPTFYLLTVALISFIADRSVLTELLSGALLLGAIFMATDYTTSPLSFSGQALYAVFCGVITMLIRISGLFSEGVAYAILIMNILVPVIDKISELLPSYKKTIKYSRRENYEKTYR